MYQKINRNSFRQFMKTRVRMLHVSKSFSWLPQENAPAKLVWHRDVTYRRAAA